MNLSSILGSIDISRDAGFAGLRLKTRRPTTSRKSAVNAYTVQLAYELKDTKIKVNAAHPGWVKTEMGGEGARWRSKTARKPAWNWRRSDEDGPNGAYVHMGETLPW